MTATPSGPGVAQTCDDITPALAGDPTITPTPE
jgi:hypothetical protein